MNIRRKIIHTALNNHRVISFIAIGLLNTFIHASIVILCIEGLNFNQICANIIAFFVANVFSFFTNCRITFKQKPSIKKYIKFFQVSMVSLILTISMSSIAEYYALHYLIGLCFVILCGPLLTFTLHKLYAFKKI
jgi:putative flippase GtrA